MKRGFLECKFEVHHGVEFGEKLREFWHLCQSINSDPERFLEILRDARSMITRIEWIRHPLEDRHLRELEQAMKPLCTTIPDRYRPCFEKLDGRFLRLIGFKERSATEGTAVIRLGKPCLILRNATSPLLLISITHVKEGAFGVFTHFRPPDPKTSAGVVGLFNKPSASFNLCFHNVLPYNLNVTVSRDGKTLNDPANVLVHPFTSMKLLKNDIDVTKPPPIVVSLIEEVKPFHIGSDLHVCVVPELNSTSTKEFENCFWTCSRYIVMHVTAAPPVPIHGLPASAPTPVPAAAMPSKSLYGPGELFDMDITRFGAAPSAYSSISSSSPSTSTSTSSSSSSSLSFGMDLPVFGMESFGGASPFGVASPFDGPSSFGFPGSCSASESVSGVRGDLFRFDEQKLPPYTSLGPRRSATCRGGEIELNYSVMGRTAIDIQLAVDAGLQPHNDHFRTLFVAFHFANALEDWKKNYIPTLGPKVQESPKCVLCLDPRPDVIFVPCAHKAVHRSCLDGTDKCCVCRLPVSAYLFT